jgi:hypothetical protein
MLLNFSVEVEGDEGNVEYIKQTLAGHVFYAKVKSVRYHPEMTDIDHRFEKEEYEEWKAGRIEL